MFWISLIINDFNYLIILFPNQLMKAFILKIFYILTLHIFKFLINGLSILIHTLASIPLHLINFIQ